MAPFSPQEGVGDWITILIDQVRLRLADHVAEVVDVGSGAEVPPGVPNPRSQAPEAFCCQRVACCRAGLLPPCRAHLIARPPGPDWHC